MSRHFVFKAHTYFYNSLKWLYKIIKKYVCIEIREYYASYSYSTYPLNYSNLVSLVKKTYIIKFFREFRPMVLV